MAVNMLKIIMVIRGQGRVRRNSSLQFVDMRRRKVMNLARILTIMENIHMPTCHVMSNLLLRTMKIIQVRHSITFDLERLTILSLQQLLH